MKFSQLISAHFNSLIDWNNPGDPLMKQVVYDPREAFHDADESGDPLKESDYSPVTGLIHKYHNRVLWLVTDHCPVHCRFCFRRCRNNQPPDTDSGNGKLRQEILKYIKTHEELDEVILSGGDPFMLPKSDLRRIIEELSDICHLRMLRIHTRCPVANPSRCLSADFPANDPGNGLITRIVVHINHSREISDKFRSCVSRFRLMHIPLLSQTVLLSGVNDNYTELRELFITLSSMGIDPYYLHELDHVTGTSHFRVDREKALKIYSELKESLPGHAVPRYVVDIPGRDSKTFF